MTYSQMIDAAFDTRRSEGKSRDQWFTELSFSEKHAVAWDLYRGQVLNGGHMQWSDNGYAALCFSHVRDVLVELKSEESQKCLELLQKAMPLLSEVSEMTNEEYEDEWEEVSKKLHQFDCQFYDMDAELQTQVEAWWEKTFAS